MVGGSQQAGAAELMCSVREERFVWRFIPTQTGIQQLSGAEIKREQGERNQQGAIREGTRRGQQSFLTCLSFPAFERKSLFIYLLTPKACIYFAKTYC